METWVSFRTQPSFIGHAHSITYCKDSTHEDLGLFLNIFEYDHKVALLQWKTNVSGQLVKIISVHKSEIYFTDFIIKITNEVSGFCLPPLVNYHTRLELDHTVNLMWE